jgi:signal transduction histidine kinase
MNTRLFSSHTVTVTRILALLLLTTTATLIVGPYFGGNVDFPSLWFRLFVVAIVMMIAFAATDSVWRETAQPRISLLTAQLIAVTVGAFIGTLVSGLLIGRSLTQMFTVEPMLWGIVVFTTVAIGIGTVTAMVLVYRERAARADVDVVRAASRQHELEKQVLEARLKLLQAQIEPHFLFNTLANVQHLVTADPPLANKVLTSLIRYLRAALPQMREGGTTLGREVELARAYLEIQAVRMGSRLDFRIDIPMELAASPFPPMMLMTLVENAIKHGIDPLQEGGEISIIASRGPIGAIAVTVADTGAGITNMSGTGVGLQNIRERLAALFDRAASLSLDENTPRGVVATIRVPQG